MTATRIDRAAAVRASMRKLVASRGLHGASMAAIAADAGVATGTAYVHYPSKDELLLAAYLELKAQLGEAAVGGINTSMPPRQRCVAMWMAIHRFLVAEPERARFLVQVDSSPMARSAHERAIADGNDPIIAKALTPDLAALLVPLPLEVIYDLSIGPAVRLVAGGEQLSSKQLRLVADGSWRAITMPG